MKRCSLGLLALVITVPAMAQDADKKEPPELVRVRKKMPEIKAALVKIRGLKFKREVKVKYQSAGDFKKFVTASLRKDMPAERMAASTRLYARLGLIPRGYDLNTAYVKLIGSQAAAYYNPANSTFYILKTDMPASELDPTTLHELQHAIQDQYFGLDKMMSSIKDNDDAATALKFLIEGEATYVMTVYSLQKMGMDDTMLEMQINMTAKMDRERLIEMSKMAMGMQGGSEAQKKSLATLEKTPRYLYRTLVDPYYKGAKMVMAVKKSGGWEAVEQLFKNPPRSTEQALHPEKLIGERDDPTALALPDLSASFGSGWSQREANTLGELGLQTIFRDVMGAKNEKACAGWDGDRLHSYERKAGKEASVVWYSTWDSLSDAKEFATAYKKLLFKKYMPKAVKPVNGVLIFTSDEGEDILLTLKGKDVLIIEGAPKGRARAIMAATLKGVARGQQAAKILQERRAEAARKAAKKRKHY
jgi:hypothetical protein